MSSFISRAKSVLTLSYFKNNPTVDDSSVRHALYLGTRVGAIEVTDQIPERALNAFPGIRVAFTREGSAFLLNNPKQWVPMPAPQTVYWVNLVTGSNTNAGTEKAPLKSIWRAHELANAGGVPVQINVFAGRANRSTGFANGDAANAFNIPSVPVIYKAIGGEVAWYGGVDLTYTLTAGTTYQSSRTNVVRVFDSVKKTTAGDYSEIPKATSLANCQATPNTWWTESGIVYVNRADGLAVVNDNTVVCLNTMANVEMTTSGNMWFLGKWRLLGGSNGNVRLQDNPTGRVYMENTVFHGVANSAGLIDSLTSLDVAAVVLNKCRFVTSDKDGANFHIRNGVIANALLIDCSGFENGTRTTSSSNNDVTTHDGGLVVEIGGDFSRSHGGNCAHADAGTMAVHIGTDAYDSYGDLDRPSGVALAGTGFHAINGAVIYKIGCKRGIEQLTNAGVINTIPVHL